MSCKTRNSSSNSYCERFCRHDSSTHFCKPEVKCRPIKRIIPSKKVDIASSKVKSYSTGVININNKVQGPKLRKLTKSVQNFNSKSDIDFCPTCGDSKDQNYCTKYHKSTLDNLCQDIETQVAIDEQRTRVRNVCDKKLIQQFKNENFNPSVSSIKHVLRKNNGNLEPIKEGTEQATSKDSLESFEVHSVEEFGNLDPEDADTIENIKYFRKKNYFECHSAKSRVSTHSSVTSLNNHKCEFRFYLNDRLFPVPLHTDHHNTIRCVECHLPVQDINSNSEISINGTIQSKVKIGEQVQDLILMLPVKKPLIIQEKRNQNNSTENNVLYFGIVKLNYDGDSVFSRTIPRDSLALRYQKGFKEFASNDKYQYEKVNESDVIII